MHDMREQQHDRETSNITTATTTHLPMSIRLEDFSQGDERLVIFHEPPEETKTKRQQQQQQKHRNTQQFKNVCGKLQATSICPRVRGTRALGKCNEKGRHRR